MLPSSQQRICFDKEMRKKNSSHCFFSYYLGSLSVVSTCQQKELVVQKQVVETKRRSSFAIWKTDSIKKQLMKQVAWHVYWWSMEILCGIHSRFPSLWFSAVNTEDSYFRVWHVLLLESYYNVEERNVLDCDGQVVEKIRVQTFKRKWNLNQRSKIHSIVSLWMRSIYFASRQSTTASLSRTACPQVTYSRFGHLFTTFSS